MKHFYRMAVPLIVVLLAASACNENYSKQEVPQTNQAAAPENYKQEEQHRTGNAGSGTTDNQQPGTPDYAGWDKKIIKNATIQLEVKEYKKYNVLVHDAARQWGGYVAQEEQNESSYKIENTLIIKVPVAQFEDLVKAVMPEGEKVLVKTITSQDVTGEVVDTKSRLEAKRQVRLRYLDLLKQAKNMEEILKVQSEINDIQEQIEAAAGRINYLSHAAALSTVQVTFFQVLDAKAPQHEEPGFGQRVLHALGSGLEWMGEMLIVLLTLWPLWLLVGTVWWGIRKWRRERAANTASKS